METISCGIMFTGLLLGALSGNILILLLVVGAGMLFAGATVIWKYIKEQPEQSQLKQYPPYRY